MVCDDCAKVLRRNSVSMLQSNVLDSMKGKALECNNVLPCLILIELLDFGECYVTLSSLRHSWASALLHFQRSCGHVWVLVVPSSCVACYLAC
jgi:hypothetical protein